MSDKIKITKKNEVYLKVDTIPSIAQELKDHFTFEVPGAKFHPKYRAKMWDGKISLYSMFTKEIYVGLKDYIEKFAKDNEYEVDLSDFTSTADTVTYDETKSFCESLSLASRGKLLEVREYQIDAIHKAITNGRLLLLSPTGSGKSLILYSLIRWNHNRGRKQLVIVPTTSLVEQLYTDFEDYSSVNNWNVEKYCNKIYADYDKVNTFDVTISTWQSLQKLPKSFFEPYDCIFGDECLHPDTNITMFDGSKKRIKDIKVGDYVQTFNEKTKEIENKKVLKIHENLSINEDMFEIETASGIKLKITGNHKVLLKTGIWKEVKNLEIGDIINSIE